MAISASIINHGRLLHIEESTVGIRLHIDPDDGNNLPLTTTTTIDKQLGHNNPNENVRLII